MKQDRMRRVDEVIKRELGGLCERLIAPDVAGLVTITGVRTAPDLRTARVFFSVLGDEQVQQDALKKLVKRRRELQRLIATHVKLKYTPVLHFVPDHTPENADRIFSIIDDLELMEVPDAGAEDQPDDADGRP